MSKTILSLEISCKSPTPDVSVRLVLDNREFLSSTAADLPKKIHHEFDDIEGEHCLRLMMSGKCMDHTRVDAQGQILEDVLITFQNFEVDGINIDQLVWDSSKYYHDFNSTQDAVVDRFFGTMGCNGFVELKFSSPVYIWLLENM